MNTASHSTIRHTLSSRYLREPLIILAAYLPYFFARSHAVSNAPQAFANAYELMHLEHSLGIFRELSLQSAAISVTLLMHVFNVIYFYGHWPLIFLCGAYLFVKNPRVYTITRNAFFISGVVAVILYALFPVAPPRLSADGIVDTLSMTVPVSYDKSRLVNPYAALPSLHVGWDLLIACGVFVATHRAPIRLLAVLLPPSMLVATVVTGNHFFIDGISGGTLAAVAFCLSMWLYRRWPAVQSRILRLIAHRSAAAGSP